MPVVSFLQCCSSTQGRPGRCRKSMSRKRSEQALGVSVVRGVFSEDHGRRRTSFSLAESGTCTHRRSAHACRQACELLVCAPRGEDCRCTAKTASMLEGSHDTHPNWTPRRRVPRRASYPVFLIDSVLRSVLSCVVCMCRRNDVRDALGRRYTSSSSDRRSPRRRCRPRR